jgi:hypothetical protein
MTSFFYSPIAYIVLFGVTVMAWLWYQVFLFRALPSPMQPPMVEPIVRVYSGASCRSSRHRHDPAADDAAHERGEAGRHLRDPHHGRSARRRWSSASSRALAIFMIAWLPWVLFMLDLRIEGGKDSTIGRC